MGAVLRSVASVVSDSLQPHGGLAHQAPLSTGFSRQESWSGLPSPAPGDLTDSGIEHRSLKALASQADSLPLSHQGGPRLMGGVM